MARLSQSRNLKGFNWLTKKRVTYHRDVAKERRELKRQAMEERKERLAVKKLEAEERAAEAKIAAADRKIATADKTVEKAEAKARGGNITEAQLEKIKAHMEREIQAQEDHKRAVLSRVGNPASWGFGIYQGTGFATEQVAHFKSKEAAETYARSHGLTGYRIQRAFAKNPCASTRKEHVSDRAKRYRANQPGCKPSGVKQCKICRSRRFLTVDHIDGNEANGAKRNLRWLCKSCNTRLGAEMARTGQGQRTEQYNPGAETAAQYKRAVAIHESHYEPGRGRVGEHDEGGAIIHDTPKSKRREFASEIWAARKAHGNPSSDSYTLQLYDELSKRGSKYHFHAGNLELAQRKAQEYADDMGFDAVLYEGDGQMVSRFTTGRPHSWPNSTDKQKLVAFSVDKYGHRLAYKIMGPPHGFYRPVRMNIDEAEMLISTGQAKEVPYRTSRNPEPAEDVSEEYDQAKRIAELFHGRPVKEEITVTENIREHDWLWRIGPLVKLKIRTLTKRNATLPFHQTEEGMVHLFCSPDGRQFYLRGGDQELDLKALGMGEGTEWYRDHMLIGEAKEITYRDKKKFHKFKLTDYFHKLGEVTKKKPMMAYNALAHKIEILGGQYKVETEDLVDGMSPGIVN
jgi:hypothetical protein